MRTRLHRTGQLGTINLIASIAYFIAFFLFGTSDSLYLNRDSMQLSAQCYGIVALLTGLMIFWLNKGTRRLFRNQKVGDETILDEDLIMAKKENGLFSFRLRVVLNALNICCGVFMAFGLMLGLEGAALFVLALIYSLVWTLLGLVFVPMSYKGERALYG